MGIEPASLTAVFCHNAPNRTAATWETQLEPFAALEFAVSDAANGIAKAVAEVAEARRERGATPVLEHGLDVFHTTREAKRILAQPWRRAEAKWDQAEAADATVAAAKRQGIDARGTAQTARAAWAKAIAAFEQTERLESAWGRAHAALELFGPEGRLNDRPRAESEITAALSDLTGPDWAKVRNYFERPPEPGVPGPDAPAVGDGRTPARVACGVGLAVVAASPPAEAGGPDHGVTPRRGA